MPGVIIFAFIAAAFCPGTDGQVYQWRGPNRNGIIPETGLLKTWPENGPELIWSFGDLGDGHTSIGPGNGRFFTTALMVQQDIFFHLIIMVSCCGKSHTDPSGMRIT